MKVGQIIKGAKGHYELIKKLPTKNGERAPVPFKARVLPGSDIPAKWALVKTPNPWSKETLTSLEREHRAYEKLVTSPNIRDIYDMTIDKQCPPGLVFEWMDYTLQDIVSESYRRSTVLHQAIMKACLTGLVALRETNLVHSNISPGNILLSNIDSSRPLIKLGSLRQALPNDYDEIAKPLAIQPPEFYDGLGRTNRADVWSLAASVFSWINPSVFRDPTWKMGVGDSPWCIATLLRLFPDWAGPHTHYQFDLKTARGLIVLSKQAEQDEKQKTNKWDDEWNEEYDEEDDGGDGIRYRTLRVSQASLEEEMKKMRIEPVLMNMFRYLLVVDPKNRPSAKEVLQSEQYRTLVKAAYATVEGRSN